MRLSKAEKRRAILAKAEGSELIWDPAKGDEQLSTLLNWYSYNKDSKNAFAYFIAYQESIEADPEWLKDVNALGEGCISNTIGWLCRILILGGKPTENVTKHLPKEIEKLNQKIKDHKAAIEAKRLAEEKITKRVVNIQERLEEELRDILGEIEGQIDDYILNKKSEFKPISFYSEKKVKSVHAKRIADHYKNLSKELKEAQAGKDEQLVEGYQFLSKKELKNYIEFVEQIISDANSWYETAKEISRSNRKPRTRKQKSPLQQIAKMKYLREHENLKSVPPTDIIGATQLWIYNIKYRNLGVYVCPNDHGFSVKGTTILNFDVASSVGKKLRKPTDVLPKVLESNKVALRKLLSTVRSKEKKLTGRINQDTILLRALK